MSWFWVVSELYHPEDTSTGHFLTGIAEGLADRVETRVLCGQPTYRARGTRAPKDEVRHGVAIHRCGGTTLDKNRIVPRLMNQVTLSCSMLVNALRRFRPGDVVLVVTNPPALPFLAAIACRVRGARCLLLVHDVYPDVLVAAGAVAPHAVLHRFMSWAMRWLLRTVDRVVVLGRDAAELLARRVADGNDRMRVIPNWADSDEIVPLPRQDNPFLAELRINDRFVVQYVGNMGRTHDVDAVLGAAKRLSGEPNVAFLFAGDGAKRPVVQASVERGDANVYLLGPVPRERLCELLNACDVSIVALRAGMAGASVPSRLYNIMASGKPVIVVSESDAEVARIVREEEIGWVVPPGRDDLLAEAVRAALGSPERRAAIGIRARAVAEQKYTREKTMAAYISLLDEVVGGS